MKPTLLKSSNDLRRKGDPEGAELEGFLSESIPATAPTIAPPAARPTKRGGKALLTILVCVGLFGAIAAAVLWLPGSAIGAKPTSGALRVESDPIGADVLIDGTALGKTPLTLSLAVGQHQLVVRSGANTQQVPLTIEGNQTMVHHISWTGDASAGAGGVTSGSLRVVTEPASAARVSIDGIDRGATPLTLTDLSPGDHDVVVRDAAGTTRRRSVTIERGATASLVFSNATPEGVASGWLAAPTATALQIYENGKLVGSTESDRIMLPVGQHTFEFANAALGFKATRDVRITAGQTTNLDMPLPRAAMSVNATPWAQVWIDGQPLGETPIGNVMQTIGSHQLIFRHPQLGERRVTTVVTLNDTTRIAVDMRKP